MARTAVLGGSFNPIHYGHLLLADDVADLLGLDRVLFVPAARPPHKPNADLAPAQDRYAMVELAIAGHPKFAVSDIEFRRPGPSYTVDTLEALRGAGEELFLIVGRDPAAEATGPRQNTPSGVSAADERGEPDARPPPCQPARTVPSRAR